MAIYKCAKDYIGSCTTIDQQIAAIEQIQMALLTQALTSIETSVANGESISQYSLNDGQTIISASYRSASEIKRDYENYEYLKNMLRNNKSGRMVRLVDHKSFYHGGF
jgi:hypothetical protein